MSAFAEGRATPFAAHAIQRYEEVTMKRLFLIMFAATMLTATCGFAASATPKTVIHVITVKWKADASPAQIGKVLEVVNTMPSQYPGITRVWTKPIKKQIPEGYSHVIVMEFANEDALRQYVDSSAQKKFYEVYMPIREESRTSDITN
jgi:antibiotic biosynthesis monooxygenase (ABM) superfamily enzyme